MEKEHDKLEEATCKCGAPLDTPEVIDLVCSGCQKISPDCNCEKIKEVK